LQNNLHAPVRRVQGDDIVLRSGFQVFGGICTRMIRMSAKPTPEDMTVAVRRIDPAAHGTRLRRIRAICSLDARTSYVRLEIGASGNPSFRPGRQPAIGLFTEFETELR
jgi:hypothetical protein